MELLSLQSIIDSFECHGISINDDMSISFKKGGTYPVYIQNGMFNVIDNTGKDIDLFLFLEKEKKNEEENEEKKEKEKEKEKKVIIKNEEKTDNKCFYCGKEIDIYYPISMKVTCGAPLCRAKKLDKSDKNTILNDTLSKFIKSEPFVWNYMLLMCEKASSSKRKHILLDPFPVTFYEEAKKLQEKRGTVIGLHNTEMDVEIPEHVYTDITNTCSIIRKATLSKKHKNIKICNEITVKDIKNFKTVNYDVIKRQVFSSIVDNDYDLIQKIGDKAYKLAHFLVTSISEMNITYENNEEYDIEMIPIRHSMDMEARLQNSDGEKVPTVFMFHGSSIDCWYSIIRNGVKNCSSTKMMTTGSAYGSGVYLSPEVTISHGYCKGGNILGIFEVDINSLKHKNVKTQVNVCMDDSKLLLRYLVILDKISIKKLMMFLQNLNTENIQKQNQNYESMSSSLSLKRKRSRKGMKRLVSEYKKAIKSKEFDIFLQDEDDLYIWNLHIKHNQFGDIDLEICKQMIQYDIPYINIEIRFPVDYPLQPPFIRVITPIFVRFSGHITSKGAICMQLLTPGNWMPTYSVESIIVQIKQQIIDGGGLVDTTRIGQTYNLSDAMQSFRVVAKGHGWI